MSEILSGVYFDRYSDDFKFPILVCPIDYTSLSSNMKIYFFLNL